MTSKPTCEEERIKTYGLYRVGKTKTEYLSWPYKTPSAENMAHWGFYFTPTKTKKDQVTCSGCLKKQAGWKGVKDVLKFHLTASPKCAFALFHKAWAQRDFHTESSVDMTSKKTKSRLREGSNGFLLLNYDWASEPVFGDAHSRETVKIRREFFKFWPKEDPSADSMVKAGFYCVPFGKQDDTSLCLYCKLSLEDWSPGDDPLAVHQKQSPECFFFKQPKSVSSGNSTRVRKNPRKRNSEEYQSDSVEDNSGALIATKQSSLNKKSKRNAAVRATSQNKKTLLDDTLSDSLGFIADFPDSNKENRTSEDFDSLQTFDKSLRKFKTLQKYNSSINRSKSKVMKVTKKKQGLLFSSDDENNAPKRTRRKKNGKNDGKGQSGSAEGSGDIKCQSQSVEGSQDDKVDSGKEDKPETDSKIQSSEVISESTRNFHGIYENDLVNNIGEETLRQSKNESETLTGAEMIHNEEQKQTEVNQATNNEPPFYELDDNDLDVSSLIEDSAIMSPEKKDPSLYSNNTPVSKLKTNIRLDPFDNFENNDSIKKLESINKNGSPPSNSYLSKDDPIHSNNTTLNQKNPLINNASDQKNIPSEPMPKQIPIPIEPIVQNVESPKMIESTRIDYCNYSLNPANLDDSEYDISISVYEKKDDQKKDDEKKADQKKNDVKKTNNMDTPIKEIPSPILSTPLFNPEAEGTSDHFHSANESTPLTPSQNNEIQLRTVDTIPQWAPKTRANISSSIEDLRKANEFLQDIANLDYQLSEDMDGVLTAFISQVPEKELNMTIGAWVQYQTEQCKKLLRIKCDEMIKQFEEDGERAIDFVMKMP